MAAEHPTQGRDPGGEESEESGRESGAARRARGEEGTEADVQAGRARDGEETRRRGRARRSLGPTSRVRRTRVSRFTNTKVRKHEGTNNHFTRTNSLFFFPAARSNTLPSTTSPSSITFPSSSTLTLFTRAPPPLINRFASPFDFCSPVAAMTSTTVRPTTSPKLSSALGMSPASASSVSASRTVSAPGFSPSVAFSAWLSPASPWTNLVTSSASLFCAVFGAYPSSFIAASIASISSIGTNVSVFMNRTTSASVLWRRC
mmetsp:Transcript_4203/g.14787  ORF Transcript_4203/g.14787 Transcript_4203/m.14787 type:complete len:260 (-) Transcript_4203:825-1604(-)